MTLKIYTDGGASGNPGPGAIGYVIYQDDKLIAKHGEAIGHSTNNFAEYTALIKALEKVKELINKTLYSSSEDRYSPVPVEVGKIIFYSDSSLMVNQLNGLFKVKNSNIREFILKVRILEQEIKSPITYTHISREKNTEADKLVKSALKY